MIWSLGFALHLMDSSLSWCFLVIFLLCTEFKLIFFIAMISFLFIYLCIYCIYAKWQSFPLTDFKVRSHVLFFSEESFLSQHFSPLLILISPVSYSICFNIYSKMHIVMSFSWTLHSYSKSISCSLGNLSLISDQFIRTDIATAFDGKYL